MEKKVFGRPTTLNEKNFTYCPGFGHGVANRLLAESIEEMGIAGDTIGVCYVGCGGMMYDFFNIDYAFPLHGRSPAVATGIKRVRPDKIVIGYQGDGDLAAIGTAEIIHAATRGENLTVIFVNNGIYGMTGGQMAPTTLLGQKTTTSPRGRDMARHEGGPIRMAELMAQLSGVAYSERCALDSVKHVRAAKKALRKAFEVQLQGLGFGFVELLSGCPTNWHMDPVSANKRISEAMIPVFPLGVYKDVTAPAESEVQHG